MRTPLPHQQQAIDRLVAQGGRQLLCDEMGLGKSSVALWVLHELTAHPIIVVCPLSITHKWCDEIRQTLPLEPRLLTHAHSANGNLAKGMTATAWVMHYELLVGLTADSVERIVGYDAGLIIDESHYVKNRLSLRSKAVRALAKRCRYVIPLTGTIVRNDVRDIWHQADLAVPGYFGSYAMFEAKYAEFRQFKLPSMRRPVKQFRSAKNEAELARRLNLIMIRRRKVDVVDLPPKQRVVIPLDLDKESSRIYHEMKQRAMATLSEMHAGLEFGSFPKDPIIARTALEQAIRLEQITNGIVGGSNLEEPVALRESAKIEWTLETARDLLEQGRSVAIFCKFNATMNAFIEAEGYPIQGMSGDTPVEARAALIQSFRSHGGIFVCQLRLAEGFDLTPCTDAIFLGIDWTPAMMDQAEDRLHRIGTTGQVTCYYPLMRKTIDERLYRVVMEKREDARRVVGDVAVMREELQAV